MKHLLRRRDTEALIDGIVDGDPVNGAAGLDDVEAFLSEMQTAFGAAPPPAPRPTLASTLDGRRPLRPASSGPRPKPTIPARRPRSHRFRPAAVVFATGAVLFGGLAGAGALPGPVQRGTAELASHVGIHLPGAPETRPKPVDRVEPGTDVPRTGDDDPSDPSGRGAGDPATTVPTVAPTTPRTVAPTTPTTVPVPAPPTTPTTSTLPLPNAGSLLEPVAPRPGLTGPVTRSGGLLTDVVP